MLPEIAAKYFNAQWYLETNGDVAQSNMDPYEHFITYGWAEGRSPTPYFDPIWYLDCNPDVRQEAKIPFEHYLEYGFFELRNPNPFFDVFWYKNKYLSASSENIDPLLHFITEGQFKNLDPSPTFDTNWYMQVNPDLSGLQISPFEHFLRYGAHEGREPNPNYVKGTPLNAARVLSLRKPRAMKEAAVFVTHSEDGRLKPHVKYHMKSLIDVGIAVVAVIATDVDFHDEDEAYSIGVSGLLTRQNIGFDFAAWAHILQLHPEMFNVDVLYLVNDSIVGPLANDLFHKLIRRIRQSEADVIGLVDSYEIGWHIQSYFLAFKRQALSSEALKTFFNNVTCHSSKQRVINAYEISLARNLADAGLFCEVLFPTERGYSRNPHIYKWRELIEAGFPFIKVTTIRDDYPGLDVSAWSIIASALGYDPKLADPVLSPRVRLSDTAISDSEHKVDRDLSTFSEYSYVMLNPDLKGLTTSLYEHYVHHGRMEGRSVHIPGLSPLEADQLRLDSRETILLVSHEELRGGAPILVYNLVKQFSKKYRVLVLFQSGGPVAEACRQEGAHVIGPIMFSASSELADFVVEKITTAAQIKFAIVNSIASRGILRSLSNSYIPTLTLIHEFASYVKPLTAFSDSTLWSGRVIFSTELTRDDAVSKCAQLHDHKFLVLPQGACDSPPHTENNPEYTQREHQRIAANFDRPSSSGRQKVIAIGAGLVEYRKGVDLFIECASAISRLDEKNDWHFIWIGRGFNVESDLYSMFLVDQVQRRGMTDKITFLGEVTDFRDVCKRSDLLLITSRLDPLPNVALDALFCSVPTFCFESSTGVAEILKKLSVEDLCVAGYLDIECMAAKAIGLVNSPEKKQRLNRTLRDASINTFGMDIYAKNLEDIAAEIINSTHQERSEAEIILKSGLFDASFATLGGSNNVDIRRVVRAYIRSWKTGIELRKPFPGFHPGIYSSRIGDRNESSDPLAHFIANGRPAGRWLNKVITPANEATHTPEHTSVALHVHCYYPELLDAIAWRIKMNNTRPDIFVSVPDMSYVSEVRQKLRASGCRVVKVDVVSNRGRDLGPFLTDFCREMVKEYSIVGHIHTKKSLDVADINVGRRWYKFLLEHLIGGRCSMLDSIVAEMRRNPRIGIVFPDDPHVIGWGDNREYAAKIWKRMFSSDIPNDINFPVGSMFWARTDAIRPILDLGFESADFPDEPLPYDGTVLHAIERLLGPIAQECAYNIATTHVPEIIR